MVIDFNFSTLNLPEMVKAWEDYKYPSKPSVPGKIVLLQTKVELEYSSEGWRKWEEKIGFEKFRSDCVETFGVDPFNPGQAHVQKTPSAYSMIRIWRNKTKQGLWLITTDETPDSSGSTTAYIKVVLYALEPHNMPRDDE